MIPLSASDETSAQVRHFELQPLYRPLRALLGEINIEAAMAIGEEFVLLNRGVHNRTANESGAPWQPRVGHAVVRPSW